MLLCGGSQGSVAGEDYQQVSSAGCLDAAKRSGLLDVAVDEEAEEANMGWDEVAVLEGAEAAGLAIVLLDIRADPPAGDPRGVRSELQDDLEMVAEERRRRGNDAAFFGDADRVAQRRITGFVRKDCLKRGWFVGPGAALTGELFKRRCGSGGEASGRKRFDKRDACQPAAAFGHGKDAGGNTGRFRRIPSHSSFGAVTRGLVENARVWFKERGQVALDQSTFPADR